MYSDSFKVFFYYDEAQRTEKSKDLNPKNILSQFVQKWYIFSYFSIMGHNRLTKFAMVSLPQKSSDNTIVQFGHNLGQTTLCLKQLCLMILSLNILKYGMMGYNSYTK